MNESELDVQTLRRCRMRAVEELLRLLRDIERQIQERIATLEGEYEAHRQMLDKP